MNPLKKNIFLIIAFVVIMFSNMCFASKPSYILDTDMGFDDWLAVLYLLENKSVDVRAITVDCQGESFCPQGGDNAERLVSLSGRSIPVFIGQSKRKNPYAFPLSIRDYASAMAVPGFQHLNMRHAVSKEPAAEVIASILERAAKVRAKVSIISIGTAANIADAYSYANKQHKTALFRKGLKMIYKGGGAFGKVINGRVSNSNIPGNIAIPGMYLCQNKTAEWNIYAAAPAMQALLSARLPVTFIPNNATNQVPMNWQVYDHLLKLSQHSRVALFTANAMKTLYALQKSWYGLNFWDTAVTVVSVYPDIVAQQYEAPVAVDLSHSKTYGTTFVAKNSADRVGIYYQLHVKQFYRDLFGVMS